MQPMQFSSLAVYMANQPRRFGVLRQANTSTGHTARQKPHALHMSSEMITSQRPAGPRDGFLSALNSGISGSDPRHRERGMRVVTRGTPIVCIQLTENTIGPGRGQVLKARPPALNELKR